MSNNCKQWYLRIPLNPWHWHFHWVSLKIPVSRYSSLFYFQNIHRINMANIWTYHVKVILWKNFLIRRRHWFLTLCEALVPVLLFLLVAYGRSKISALSKHEVINVTYNDPFLLSYGNPGINLEETQLLFAPSTTYHDDIIHRVQEKFQIINNSELYRKAITPNGYFWMHIFADIHGFSNADQLLKYYVKSSNTSVVAIIFSSPPNSSSLDYTIRLHNQYYSWSTNRLYENQFTFIPGVGMCIVFNSGVDPGSCCCR